MSDRPPCVRAPRPHRILASPLALSLALALTASGCSPGPAQNQVGGAATSKVPKIAKRQKHMEEMLKKGESKAKSPAKPDRSRAAPATVAGTAGPGNFPSLHSPTTRLQEEEPPCERIDRNPDPVASR